MTMLLQCSIGNCVKLCVNFKKCEKWYPHNPQTVSDVNHKFTWNMKIQLDNVIEERKLDIVIANKMEKTTIIIDVAIPGDKRIIDKEEKKISIRISKEGFRDFAALKN